MCHELFIREKDKERERNNAFILLALVYFSNCAMVILFWAPLFFFKKHGGTSHNVQKNC